MAMYELKLLASVLNGLKKRGPDFTQWGAILLKVWYTLDRFVLSRLVNIILGKCSITDSYHDDNPHAPSWFTIRYRSSCIYHPQGV